MAYYNLWLSYAGDAPIFGGECVIEKKKKQIGSDRELRASEVHNFRFRSVVR